MTQRAWLCGVSPREPPVPSRIKRCWPELNRVSSGPSVGHSASVQGHSLPGFQSPSWDWSCSDGEHRTLDKPSSYQPLCALRKCPLLWPRHCHRVSLSFYPSSVNRHNKSFLLENAEVHYAIPPCMDGQTEARAFKSLAWDH